MDLAPATHTADLHKLMTDSMKRLLRAVAGHADDATLKECVMIARADGWISDEETSFFINAWGLAEA